MLHFLAFITAMFITMALIPPLIRVSERYKFVDLPDEARKIHDHPVPRIGGIAMILGSTIPIVIWLAPDPQVLALMAAVGVLFLFGIADDLYNLSHRWKFLGQILASLIVIYFGDVRIDLMPLYGLEPVHPYFSVPFTVFALVGITNAINLSDGLDGLAGGTTLLSFCIIALLAFHADGGAVVLMALAIMGSILGFLRYNTHPATIFMGDNGSQFLGFTVGVLTVMLTQSVNPALSPAITLLILGLPIFDTFYVIGARVIGGRSPFKPDNNHIHHRLLALNFDHYESVFLIYFFQSLLIIGAYLMRYESDWLIMGLYISFCLLVVMTFQFARRSGWQAHYFHYPGQESAFQGHARWLLHSGRVSQWSFWFVIVTVPLFMVLAAALARQVEFATAYLALGLVGILAIYYVIRHQPQFSWVERAGFYMASSVLVYSAETSPAISPLLHTFINGYFVVLTLALVAGFRFSQKRKFQVTPLDFLVIFIAVVVPYLPGEEFRDAIVAPVVAKMLILFYASEFILLYMDGKGVLLRPTLYVALLVLALKGLLFA